MSPGERHPGRVARACVVGAGLIGGAVALRLQATGVQVTVVDPDEQTRARAAGAGLRAVEAVGQDGAGDADLVVLATPLDALGAAMTDVAAASPYALVVDVGSVKQAPAAAAVRAGLADRYVGCHPMAGTEQAGFAHADPGLLVGATWAVTHPDPAAAGQVTWLVPWLTATFDATVVLLDPAEHDRSVALVSHAPHVLANALLGLVEDAGPLARLLAAGSFRDVTRVAGTHPERTHNMLAGNAAALDDVLGRLAESLDGYRRDLADVDPADPTDAASAALLARLQRVAASAEPGRSALSWQPCDDLDAVVEQALTGGRPVLVRGREDDAGLEWAETT